MTEASAAPAVTLEDARPGDLDAIMVIENGEFLTDAWSEDAMAADLASDHTRYLVAVRGPEREVIGYGGLFAPAGGTDGDIQTIAVASSARGQGLGRALMTGLHGRARELGVTEIFLEVREDNPVARNLYVSLGYEEIGVRPGYYQPANVDAIVMRVHLTPTTQNGIGR